MRTRKEIHEDYDGFIEKFKPKKTTDDCYTPPEVYETVKNWACEYYGINPDNIVRPFYPGGNYEKYEYPKGAVVLDNPPFSILSKILDFYIEKGIAFFLFAPTMTMMSSMSNKDVNAIIVNCAIEYENGAKVATSFLTSFGDFAIEVNPALNDAINNTMKKIKKESKKQLPKYHYPSEVVMANDLKYLAKNGQNFKVKRKDIYFIRQLDSQKEKKKSLFGAGFLLSKKAAAEKAAAEKAAAEKAAAEKAYIWELSEREKKIIENLG